MTLDELNALPPDEFTRALGGVFEHSPWVAQRAAAHRPYRSVGALHAAMCDVVAAASADEQLALVRAHPQLAGKAAIRDALTPASRSEQRGAGLDACSPEEFTRLNELNAAYYTKFGFPFILAVRGHTRDSVIASLETRLYNPREDELAESLRQIERIAALRLADMIREPDGGAD